MLVTWVPFNGFLKFCLGSQICGDNCVMAIEAKSWRKAADYQSFPMSSSKEEVSVSCWKGMTTRFSMQKLAEAQEKNAKGGLVNGLLSKKRSRTSDVSKDDLMAHEALSMDDLSPLMAKSSNEALGESLFVSRKLLDLEKKVLHFGIPLSFVALHYSESTLPISQEGLDLLLLHNIWLMCNLCFHLVLQGTLLSLGKMT
ncbi:hypothetical protein CMV_010068 [Castanea mollissima]|uniref:Uncharacterized protein n=1 Tax=Castanea mollissima TaxID=60419 RepID=A0A8J4VQB2_9ROSI|nr:hypothetical protein CMV_010068 [Castanea mollissima]